MPEQLWVVSNSIYRGERTWRSLTFIEGECETDLSFLQCLKVHRSLSRYTTMAWLLQVDRSVLPCTYGPGSLNAYWEIKPGDQLISYWDRRCSRDTGGVYVIDVRSSC